MVLGRFFQDEAGGMTVDWVALSASILMLAVALVYALFSDGVADLVGVVQTTLSDQSSLDPGPAPDQSTFE